MGNQRKRWLTGLSVLLALSMVAGACGDDDDDGGGQDTTETTAGEGKRGGEITVAAEQWPECINPITSCANSSWTGWSVTNYVFPQLLEIDAEGKFVPSPLLEGEPEITEEPFAVTYTIRDDAVWDDGSQITSADVEFTWQTKSATPGALITAGYDQIESIDTSDPKTFTINFKQPYAGWQDLFGGNQSYVLKKAAFQSPDVSKDMLDNIPFSGGPFKLESWSDQQAVLVRNEAYWDEERVPLLDRVIMVPRTDQDTEITALLTGEVSAIFPQPAPGFAQKVNNPNIEFEVGSSVTFEGLWFNLDEFPVNDKAVREAMLYAVDRQAIVDTVIAQIVPGIEVLNCGGWVPHIGDWCDEEDFADATYDPDKAKEILTAAGWAPGSDGIMAKGGRKLSIKWATVAGNKRREDTQQLVIQQAKAAGIELVTDNSDAGELFDNRLPQRNFVMGEYAQVASPDPSVTSIFGCDNIPGPANGGKGQNYLGWCNEAADAAMKQADQTVDVDERVELTHKIGDEVRRDVAWIPLYVLPNITAWRTDRLEGPIGVFTSSTNGGFWNMWDWSLK